MEHRRVRRVMAGLLVIMLICSCFSHPVQTMAGIYDKYSTKEVGWGLGLNKNHTTPGGSYPYSGFSLKKYDALYVGDTADKKIYLTIDCGYEIGCTPSILDTLKKNDIKAVFFVTKQFVEEKPDLVKRMKQEGHLVGNHTVHHKNLARCSVEQIKSEISGVEKIMKEKTGYEMDKFARPPEGAYSERALKVLQDMGYHTVFWSLAWMDWDPKNQPSVDTVVGKFKTYYHNGMIPLMHNTSSADTKALPQVITYMKSIGFTFARVDEIFLKEPKLQVTVKDMEYSGELPSVQVKTNSKGEQKITYFDKEGKKIKYPKNVGTYRVHVELASDGTYAAAAAEQKFKITKAVPAVRISMPKSIYAGEDYEPVIKTKNKNGELSISYFNEAGRKIEKPQTAGNYQFKVKIAATDNYKTVVTEKMPFMILDAVNDLVQEDSTADMVTDTTSGDSDL